MMFDLEQLLDGLPERNTVTFFAAFFRFEYALMDRGLVLDQGRPPRAAPNWTKLGEILGEDFFLMAKKLAPTIVNDPPKTLITQGGRVAFGARPKPATNTKELLQYLRQVRNNLFHGNKMFAANRARDERLMRESLLLIDLILQRQDDLRYAFHEPQANF
ncbi:MAG: hypothetical protein JSR61_20995 [Proteobacteria bacterium]|nr:hypothetical protein [Pseudomonadota bacterium]